MATATPRWHNTNVNYSHAAADATMEYLNAEFDRKNNHLKALTTKGSFLNSIRFATEMTGTEGMFDSVTNDDLILGTTLCLVDTSNDGTCNWAGSHYAYGAAGMQSKLVQSLVKSFNFVILSPTKHHACLTIYV